MENDTHATHLASAVQTPAGRLSVPAWLWVTLLMLALPVALFLVNPLQPLVEHHSFRQTQTAITAYWLMHGGAFFRYLTPVLGYPWTLPMEFPLYQGIVAWLSSHLGWPLDFTGRLVTLVFFCLTPLPIVWCLRRYGWPAALFACALFLTSPVDLFFSRTFLIESFATLLSLTALCLYIAYVRSGRGVFLVLFCVCGTLAGLQKITTFLPVAGVCVADALWAAIAGTRRAGEGQAGLEQVSAKPAAASEAADSQAGAGRAGGWRSLHIKPLLAIGTSGILPIWWALWSDSVKSAGALTVMETSGKLRAWNFGTVALRLNPDYWLTVFGDRILLYGGLSLALALVLVAVHRKAALWSREALLFAGAGLLGPLVFANLHFVHDYYQVGSIAFLACALGVVLSPWLASWSSGSHARFALLALLLMVSNLSLYYERYWRSVNNAAPLNDVVAYNIGNYLSSRLSPDDVIVAIGLDWSSTLPYYARRYALMIPDWAPDRSAMVADPRPYLGGRAVGSIVYCNTGQRDREAAQAEMHRLFDQIEGPVATLAHCAFKVRETK